MRKSLLFLLLSLLTGAGAFASHIRGGEITASRRVGNTYTYDFVLNIYRDTTSAVEDQENTLYFGDGQQDTQPVSTVIPLLGSATEIWTYRFTHTYNSPGQYTAYHFKDFRNSTVLNLGGNSGAIKFYVETQITISPTIDQGMTNNTPVLFSFAVDIAGVGQVYVHNPTAYDADGDSLSYTLFPSRTYVEGLGDQDISNYKYPNDQFAGPDSANTGPATLTVHPTKGLLRWDVPFREGEYNCAIVISEWRFGRRIGYVVRDMQIIVRDVQNKRPQLTIPQDTCVIANTGLDKYIYARDLDSTDKLAITATGGLFSLTPLSVSATLDPPSAGTNGFPIYQTNPARSRFRWQPGCQQVRTQPYDATFKAQDLPLIPSGIRAPLVDIKTWSIRVIGPPPENFRTTAGLGSITLDWDPYICNNITGFNIYRRVDSSTFRPDTCTVGVPPEEGFTYIGSTEGIQTTFLDDNNGQGLKRSYRYCYRITAQFEGSNRGESKESNQVCAQLRLDVPLLTNVSVDETDSLTGKMFIRWTRPKELDLSRFPGPYRYQLKRSRFGDVFNTIKSTTDLNDTTFLDEGLDTKEKIYTYRVVFFFQDNSGVTYRDSADDAQNIQLLGQSNGRSIDLAWTARVPWDNTPFDHYIYKEVGSDFVLIDTVPGSAANYTDVGKPEPLIPNNYYRYKVETRGRYSLTGIASPLINFSYILRIRHKDTIPPCPPQELVITNQQLECPSCTELVANPNRTNNLTWRGPRRDSCALDLLAYRIYFKPSQNSAWTLVRVTTDTTFSHSDNGSLAGCYKVTTIDTSGNENLVVDSVCNDNCIGVELPNLITKNSDAFNDYWRPICITQGLLQEAELVVYNRWGREMYKSTNLDIRWPGTAEGDDDILPGTYYYYLKLKTKRLNDDNPYETFRGWIEVNRKLP